MRAIALRPADRRLLTIDSYGNVREWPSPTAQPAALDSGRALERAGKAALADSGRKLIVLKAPDDPDQPAQFTVYDLATGRVLRQFERRDSGVLLFNDIQNPFEISTQGSRMALSVRTQDDADIVSPGHDLSRAQWGWIRRSYLVDDGLYFDRAMVNPGDW